MKSIFLLCFYISFVFGDTYLHNPRGSNNRLNEKSANRANGNRMYDSQNNNRGGYNAADIHKNQGFTAYATDAQAYDYDNTDWQNNNGKVQFEEMFLEDSTMNVSWTAQHGCGNAKNNCNFVWQWACDTHDINDDNALNSNREVAGVFYEKDGLRMQLRNGLNTNTPGAANGIGNVQNQFNNNNANGVGRHESEEWYAYGQRRERNKGLFTADQKVGGKSVNTRQNPGGTRRGLEVPEERDYYPHWRPSPFKTAAIFHNDMTECDQQMLQKDQANEAKVQCVPQKGTTWGSINDDVIEARTEAECTAANGRWMSYIQPAAVPKPACVQNDWSQVNNLGNVAGTLNGGLPRNYDWKLPTATQLEAAGCFRYTTNNGGAGNSITGDYFRLIGRMRYNMTTGDYDPYKTTKDCNQNNQGGVQSPVNQNPTVDVGYMMQGLRLAINTAQTGRTFQDRTHVFRVMQRPNNIPLSKPVKNQNVQGKRGNIVQTYPAVEYDFWPKIQEVKVGECIAYAWVGSNTHNNGNPGGDGQTGDAGEGQGGTDRHNLVQLSLEEQTYPVPLDKTADFFTQNDCYKTYTGEPISSGNAGSTSIQDKDLQIYLMSNGFYSSYSKGAESLVTKSQQAGGDGEMNVLLNDTPASLRSVTCCPKAVGEWVFAGSRNNNFTNRDQKLRMKVTAASTSG